MKNACARCIRSFWVASGKSMIQVQMSAAKWNNSCIYFSLGPQWLLIPFYLLVSGHLSTFKPGTTELEGHRLPYFHGLNSTLEGVGYCCCLWCVGSSRGFRRAQHPVMVLPAWSSSHIHGNEFSNFHQHPYCRCLELFLEIWAQLDAGFKSHLHSDKETPQSWVQALA